MGLSIINRCQYRKGHIMVIVLIIFNALTPQLFAQQTNAKEYYIKAGFLVNFARLVEWPPVSSTEKESKIVIGILDPEPFGESLEAISDKEIHGKKITIVVCDETTDFTGIHILFLNSKDAAYRRAIVHQIGTSPILTIGESPGFAKDEGIINFYKLKNKLRFEINKTRADDAGLKISSRLLKLGRIIEATGS